MFRSKDAAEKAAIAGEGQQDFDTQQCLDLQNQILSSSPRSPNRELASNNNRDSIVESIASHLSSVLHAERNPSVSATEPTTYIEQCTAVPADQTADDGSTSGKALTKLGRDNKGRLRPLDATGREHRISDTKRKDGTAMNDLTQLSSLSPTQENSQSVYERFDLQRSFRKGGVSSSIEERIADVDGDGRHTQVNHESLTSKQQHFSAKTDSTAHTYGENDTGHVHFDFLTRPVENHNMDEISQDASFAPRMDELPRVDSYEPQTPAPPKNPFSQKGSVMKGDEMFGATQPSSIGRRMASPNSSRPSPDVYHNSSPQKRPISSPLVHRGDETSPLQSSARSLPRSRSTGSPSRVGAPQPSISRSLDSRRINSREPRDIYISEKESQERRQKEASATSASSLEFDSSEPDSDIDAIPLKNQRKREREANEAEIQRRLAKITSTRPGSVSSGMVEVPSTGRRRRSQHEEYVAQCEGLDARDTQQDVIIDSQTVLEEPEDLALPATAHPSRPLGTNPCSYESNEIASPVLPRRRTSIPELERVLDLHPNSPGGMTPNAPMNPSSPLQPPSLPPQDAFTNHNDLRTPMTSKNQILSDGADATIPNTILETSPLGEDRILPMGEVTSFSFTQHTHDPIIEEAPGFTQDEEFEDAIRPQKSPTPPLRRSRVTRDRCFPSFAEAPMPTEIPKTSTPDQPSIPEPPMSKEPDVPATTATAKENEQPPGIGNGEENRFQVAEKQVEDELGIHDDDELRKKEQRAPDPVIHEPGNQLEAGTVRSSEVGPDELQVQMEPALKFAQNSSQAPVERREGLRSKEELQGPSKQLRRSGVAITPKPSIAPPPSTHSSKRHSDFSSTLSTPRPSRASKPSPATKSSARMPPRPNPRKKEETPIPAPRSSARKSSTQARVNKEGAPVSGLSQKRPSRRPVTKAQVSEEKTSASAPAKRSLKRKSGVSLVEDEEPALTRSSKRQTTSHAARESNGDPLTLPVSAMSVVPLTKKTIGLFRNMAFAVSYVKQQEERARVSHLIAEQGGRVLEEGFDSLFDPVSLSKSRPQGGEDADLVLSSAAKFIGFIALIADEHSRKAKYMQALAMGLPCISGRWILGCVAKEEVIDWTPYLLCAGQSSFLGNAIRSRTLQPYSATEASFDETFSSRERLLDGKSILLVTGKGRAEDTRKAYVFLTRVLGPARVGQVVDNEQARKKLQDDESWDLLYVDKNEDAAETAVFGSATNSGAKKRKKGPIETDESGPPPKKIRVISDETVIQSLILGKLLEE